MSSVPPDEEGLDDNYLACVTDLLADQLDYSQVTRLSSVHGGLVNKACVYNTHKGHVFVKYARRDNAYEMFRAEMESLKIIADTDTVRVPVPEQVLAHPEGGAILVMEYLPCLEKMHSQWEELGTNMGRLHAHNPNLLRASDSHDRSIHKSQIEPVRRFGFDFPMHMGPRFQVPAVWCDTWEEFYVRHILKAQFGQVEKTTGDRDLLELWTELQPLVHKAWRHTQILPSLLHGDFCSINVGQIQDQAVIFDPTSMYGHSENDFTILFMEHDFPASFYKAYKQSFGSQPLEESSSSLVYQLSAAILIYNVPLDRDSMKTQALMHGMNLLKLLS